MLKKFATFDSSSRLTPEQDDMRHPFERDRDRVIHSVAFRRLQYKTQVFINSEGDHYRTRLTHSLEVAQIARSISRRLGLNEDLAELVSLAHDLGHPPFGHNGEYALQEIAKDYGGFDHNAQALRILCYLENRHSLFDGLNLTPQSIDAILKHNGPIELMYYGKRKGDNASETIGNIANNYNIRLDNQTFPEGQVAAISDDIAYCSHDIDDGIRANLITMEELLSVKGIAEMTNGIDLSHPRAIFAIIRKLTASMTRDIINRSIDNINANRIKDIEGFINHTYPLIGLSEGMYQTQQELKKLLFSRIYSHTKHTELGINSNKIVKELFNYFMEFPNKLPTNWQKRLQSAPKPIVILDYIAGMTDRYALQEYKRVL